MAEQESAGWKRAAVSMCLLLRGGDTPGYPLPQSPSSQYSLQLDTSACVIESPGLSAPW